MVVRNCQEGPIRAQGACERDGRALERESQAMDLLSVLCV